TQRKFHVAFEPRPGRGEMIFASPLARSQHGCPRTRHPYPLIREQRLIESSSGRESHPSALTEPDVKLAPHPAPTLQPPAARQAAPGRTDWGPAARCIPANASMLVPGV